MALRGFSVGGAARSLVVLGGLATQACNLGAGYADFGKDLAKPEEAVIDGPGTKIADLRLSGMLVDPWGDDGAVVVGFRYMDDGPHLYLQPFDGSAGCDAGLAYRCIVFNRIDGQPQLIAYLSDVQSTQRGTLNFVDHHCKIQYGGIADAELPSRLFDFPPGVVVATGDELLDIDPFAKTTRSLTKNLRFWSGPGQTGQTLPHYYVGDGQLVVFDDQRQELIRRGKDVTEVVFESSNQNAGVFLVDQGSLVRYVSTDNVPPETIDDNACSAKLGSYGVSYFSPCADRTLVIRDLDTSSKVAIDTGVNRLLYAEKRPAASGTGVDQFALYTKPSADDPSFEDLWRKEPGKDPVLWLKRLGQFISGTSSPKVTAVVDSDGVFGRLVSADSNGETTLLDQVVLDYGVDALTDSWLAMTNWHDISGSVVLVDSQGTSTTIAEGVTLNSKIVAPMVDPYLDGVSDKDYYGLGAFVSNYNTGYGDLGIMTRAKPTTLAQVGHKVRVANFEFFRNMAALAFLDEFDDKAGTGRLVVHQTTLNADSVVSSNVVDFTELLWPYEGVIYTAKKDGKYSLWAARAK